MRSIASGKFCHSALCSRGRRKAPCPGYGVAAVCGMVSRTDVQHRLREILPLCTLLPGAAQSACPGYGVTAVCGMVARTDAQHRLREILPLCTLLPGAAQSACPGYGVAAVCGQDSAIRATGLPLSAGRVALPCQPQLLQVAIQLQIGLQACYLTADKRHLFMFFQLLTPLLRHVRQSRVDPFQILKIG